MNRVVWVGDGVLHHPVVPLQPLRVLVIENLVYEQIEDLLRLPGLLVHRVQEGLAHVCNWAP